MAQFGRRDGGVGVLAAAVALVAACGPASNPPGRSTGSAPAPLQLGKPDAIGGSDNVTAPIGEPASAQPAARSATEPGHGDKIASIAMRTWIYVAPHDRSTKLGYLRAGAVVDRAEAPAGTEGCAGGWYRVRPARLRVRRQGRLAGARPPGRRGRRAGAPRRGQPLPYHYVISRIAAAAPATSACPTRRSRSAVEGVTRVGSSSWSLRHTTCSASPDPPTPFLAAGRDSPKPYGAEEKLHYSVHTGRARKEARPSA